MEVFKKYRRLALRKAYKVHNIVLNIQKRVARQLNVNLKYKRGLLTSKTGDLLSIVGNVDILIVAYRTVKKNAGAMTSAWRLPPEEFNRLSSEQQTLLNSLFIAPDALDYNLLVQIADLVKRNKYPWGVSRLVWIPKPGTTKLRPLTIPPFADRIVQEAIRMVLEAVFEPIFQKMNCSFGFRASNGVHQAVSLLSERRLTNGLHMALEGDIESAYPNVNRKILIKTLSEYISDTKFLSFIEKRLNLRLYDTQDNTYKQTLLGIPQGGIDSPYLWNIYFLGFDHFVQTRLKEKFDLLNIGRLQSQERGAKKGLLRTMIKNAAINPLYNRINREISDLKENAIALRNDIPLKERKIKISWEPYFRAIKNYGI